MFCWVYWHIACQWGLSAALLKKRQRSRGSSAQHRRSSAVLFSPRGTLRSHCHSKAHSILKDASYPGHHLFQLLASGRQYRIIKAETNSALYNGLYNDSGRHTHIYICTHLYLYTVFIRNSYFSIFWMVRVLSVQWMGQHIILMCFWQNHIKRSRSSD